MGKLNIPVIPPEELAQLELSEYARPRVEQTQQLAPYGLPSNLDAWDGYPAARERLFDMLTSHATNPISLAGPALRCAQEMVSVVTETRSVAMRGIYPNALLLREQ